MSVLIKSPESITGAFLKGAGWVALCIGFPIGIPGEIMIFKGARSAMEFWIDQRTMALALLILLALGGGIMAIRAALYKWAYDEAR